MSVELGFNFFLEKFEGSEVAIVQDSLNNLWIRATVACEKLGFSDAHRTVTTYCKEHQYQQFKVGNGRPALYVNESGFYRLVLKSKTPDAEKFIDWLTEDVIKKLRASGGYIMPTATSEQLEGLIKSANEKLKLRYNARSVKFKTDKGGDTKMTVLRNGGVEYETYISDKSKPSLVNPQILIIGHYDNRVDDCSIDIDSPLKEAYVRWRDYDHVYDRKWTRAELEEWVRVNFPVK